MMTDYHVTRKLLIYSKFDYILKNAVLQKWGRTQFRRAYDVGTPHFKVGKER